MNLLAHALLSPPDPAVLAGNLTADWVKGRARDALPADMRRGMDLHACIDTFTDNHPLVWRCAELLEPNWGRYSPILVDILFDHVLSVDWSHWCTRPRAAVIAEAYAALRQYLDLLPPRAHWATSALLRDDWFTSYATLDGIALSLSRLSARLRSRGHDIELAPAVTDFLAHKPTFHAAFAEFFLQLRQEVERWTQSRVD
jgi:acyl carrier protein phosphodiesterase